MNKFLSMLFMVSSLALAADAPVVTVQLINSVTQRPVANTPVVMKNYVVVQCKRAPCPPSERTWTGTTDDKGILKVPQEELREGGRFEVKDFDRAEFFKLGAQVQLSPVGMPRGKPAGK